MRLDNKQNEISALIQQRFWPAVLLGLVFVPSWNLAIAGIVGSKHDFAAAGWNPGGEICAVCHAPHTNSANSNTPLWNHTESTASYTLYSSPGLIGTIEQPRTASKMCLSCHDGTIAVDSFGGKSGSTFIQGDSNFSTDLSSSHPISITWEHRDARDCFNCHDIHGGNTVFTSALPFYNGRVECPTCHDPHNNTPDNPSSTYMLRLSMSQSELCLHCHNK